MSLCFPGACAWKKLPATFPVCFRIFFFLDRLHLGLSRAAERWEGPSPEQGYCCKWLLLQQLDLDLKKEGGVVFVNTSLASRIAASASSGFCQLTLSKAPSPDEMSWSFLSTLWGCYWAVYIPAKLATATEKKAHLPSVLAVTLTRKILCT